MLLVVSLFLLLLQYLFNDEYYLCFSIRKEQVKAVQQALKELKLEAVIIGLAKDERHLN